jgi:hypothetical protein
MPLSSVSSKASIAWSLARSKENELAMQYYSGALEILSEQADPNSAVELEMLLGQVLFGSACSESISSAPE